MHNHKRDIPTKLQDYAPQIIKDIFKVKLSNNNMEEDKLIYSSINNGVLIFKGAYDCFSLCLPNIVARKKSCKSMFHLLYPLSVRDCLIM